MKAIDILKETAANEALATHIEVWNYDGETPVREWINGIFGGFHVSRGKIEAGDYLAVWSAYSNDIFPFQVHHVPDVELWIDDASKAVYGDSVIYLWRIE